MAISQEEKSKEILTQFKNDEAIIINDRTGKILGSNSTARDLFGNSRLLEGLEFRSLFADQYHSVIGDVLEDRDGKTDDRHNVLGIHENGSFVPVEIIAHDIEVGGQEHTVVVLHDSVATRNHAEAMRHIAQHDALTGLPNRNYFKEKIIEEIRGSEKTETLMSVMFLDLDKFKDVNDTMGHAVGDALLQAVSGRLKNCVRKSDTVARLGGDEFAVIQVGVKHIDGVKILANRIIESLARPFVIEDNEIHTSGSIGVSVCPFDSNDPDEMLRNADMAMYSAKAEGRNNFQLYSAELDHQARLRKSMEDSLRQALSEEQFSLNFQPRLDLASGKVVGAEALIRWKTAMGFISPAEFIPIAEEIGVIEDISDWVLRKAVQQAKEWDDAGMPIKVSVNISAVEFRKHDMHTKVSQALLDSGLNPKLLELEITEGVLMKRNSKTVHQIAALRDVGVEFAIDDFGTGYSSLGYLKRLPVDTLKVDRSFICGITADESDDAITKVIVMLGQTLGLRVVAEGVENKKQLHFLRTIGCHEIQGYYLSKPLESEAFEAFVKRHENNAEYHIEEIELDHKTLPAVVNS